MSCSRKPPAAAAAVALAGVALVGLLVWNGHPRTGWLVVLLTVGVVARLRTQPMELTFDVGGPERHRIVFRFDKFWGNLSITVDGVRIVGDLRIFSLQLTKTYAFRVGTSEVHHVRIEKDRARLLAGLRGQRVRAYVDDVLTAEGSA